jgi:sulfopyruvate decarboxylase TPP-binding subunit
VTAVALPVAAWTIADALTLAEVTHVVTVPDTHQRTVLDLLEERRRVPVVRAATEDDVLGICAGLWIGGRRPVALIQQLGIFASVNALRGITYDLQMPLSILAGVYGREVDRAIGDSPKSSVRLCLPVLEALGIRARLLDGPVGADDLGRWLAEPFVALDTGVVLLGAPTS